MSRPGSYPRPDHPPSDPIHISPRMSPPQAEAAYLHTLAFSRRSPPAPGDHLYPSPPPSPPPFLCTLSDTPLAHPIPGAAHALLGLLEAREGGVSRRECGGVSSQGGGVYGLLESREGGVSRRERGGVSTQGGGGYSREEGEVNSRQGEEASSPGSGICNSTGGAHIPEVGGGVREGGREGVREGLREGLRGGVSLSSRLVALEALGALVGDEQGVGLHADGGDDVALAVVRHLADIITGPADGGARAVAARALSQLAARALSAAELAQLAQLAVSGHTPSRGEEGYPPRDTPPSNTPSRDPAQPPPAPSSDIAPALRSRVQSPPPPPHAAAAAAAAAALRLALSEPSVREALATSLRVDRDRYVRAHAFEALASLVVADAIGGAIGGGLKDAAEGEGLLRVPSDAMGRLNRLARPDHDTLRGILATAVPLTHVEEALRRARLAATLDGAEQRDSCRQSAVRWLCARRRCPLTAPESPF